MASKSTIFIMYITQNAHTVVDGRGFAAQKKNAIPGGVEVEKGIFSGEREISSLQFGYCKYSKHSKCCGNCVLYRTTSF